MRLLALCQLMTLLFVAVLSDNSDIQQNSYKACRIGSECYLFINKALPWRMAAQICHKRNGLLSAPQGADKNEWILARLKQFQMPSTFLGIRYEPAQHNFVTINGSLPTFMNNQMPFKVNLANNKASTALLKRRKRHIRRVYYRRRYYKRRYYRRKYHRRRYYRRKYYRRRYYRRKYYRRRYYRRKYYRKRYYRRRYHRRRYYRRKTNLYWRRYHRRVIIKRFHYRKWWLKYQRRKRRRMRKMYRIRIRKIRLIKRRKMRIIKLWKKMLVWLKKVQWEVWIKTISGINSRVWIKRIREITVIVSQRRVKRVKFTWNLWYRELVKWYKEWIKKYTKTQSRMIWRWKKFVSWLVRIQWKQVIVQVTGIDVKLWQGRLARIIFIITNLKYSKICDKKWRKWKIKIEPWLRLIYEKKTRIIKNDRKTKIILEWTRRLQWIKKHKVITFIKFGEKFSSWRREALTIVKQIKHAIRKLNIRVLEEKTILHKWQQIKTSVKHEITGHSKKTTTSVTKYIKWVNRYSWLKSNNIDFVIKQKSSTKLQKYLKNMRGMLKESEFEVKSETKIRRYYKKLEVVINTQRTIVRSKVKEFTLHLNKRSITQPQPAYGIPQYSGPIRTLKIAQAMQHLQQIHTEFPLLEKFLRTSILRLFYLSSRIQSTDFMPNKVLFQKLINDELSTFHEVKVPQQVWSLVGALNLPGVQIILNNQACVSMSHQKVGNAQRWVQTSCDKPQPFVCALTH